jgi:hypothetical protein
MKQPDWAQRAVEKRCPAACIAEADVDMVAALLRAHQRRVVRMVRKKRDAVYDIHGDASDYLRGNRDAFDVIYAALKEMEK